MNTISIPYGPGAKRLHFPFFSYEVLHPRNPGGNGHAEEEIVKNAMLQPICSLPLAELAKGKRSAVIIISDHTRPVPSSIILPPMLEELRKGSADIAITLLVATGCHRQTTAEELRRKLGNDIWNRENIVVHNCDDEKNMVFLGSLPSGAPLWVNRVAVQADLLLAEGFIEPHFFAGFSGGRKSVLPGICSRRTVMANHCANFIDDPLSRAGILTGNPIHGDMVAAAKMARLSYIVNVILDSNKKIIYAVAGAPFQAHEAGCRIMREIAGVHPMRPGDIVITSNGGAPLDQNVYQVVKSLATAEAAAAEGADIIVCAACADGIGGEQFYHAMKECSSPAELLRQIRSVRAEDTVADQWQYQILCRILEKHRVLFVTDPSLKNAITDMKMVYCPSLDAATDIAMKKHPHGHAVILPDGVSTMCR